MSDGAKSKSGKVIQQTGASTSLSLINQVHSSPDSSGNPFMAGFAIKDCNG
ncbi:MAG: hypothetical protein ABIP27_12930 [Flavobacterium circumlabens]|uniref:hypothetical protein n=1 Tax=Flavobacterium circumlabens TaxID=2133765 RepID=UPI003266DFDE